MLRDALRDLQWRRRRFIIAIVGTSLVFALTLLVGGIAESFRAEAKRTVDALGADGWVTRKGAGGPFTSTSFVPASLAQQLSRRSESTGPVIVMLLPVRTPKFWTPQIVGHDIGGLGAPPVDEGRGLRATGEAVADDRLGVTVGSVIKIGERNFNVVGSSHGLTLFGGVPNVYISIRDAQQLAFNGLPLATAILVRGHPSLPAGYHALSREELRMDMLRPLKNAISTIDFVRYMLWVVAGSIIGAVIYLTALERVRDFAVLKATGSSSATVVGGLSLESTIISVVAAILASGIARLLVPLFPLAVEIPTLSQLILLIAAIVIGIAASLFAVRRATGVDPAIAFGGP